MVNVVAYARFSSDNQRDESIDAQARAIREFCNKNNYNLINLYHDNAISGTSVKDREQFVKMIKDSERKMFKYVIVHKFDRFARNRYDHAIYEKKLEDNGVRLISVLENLNDSPESVILKSVLTGMNEYYSLNLAREVRKGQKENALKAKHNGGIPPLGYDLTKDKSYVINEKEAEAVKLIFKMYLEGRGYASIASELNLMGYLNKLGRPFKKISIRDTLLNEKYTGTFVFGKKDKHGNLTNKEIKVENGIPAIISSGDFEKVQLKIHSRKIRPRNLKSEKSYVLTGLCFCGECGGTYSGGYRSRNRNGSITYGYQCRNRKDKVNNCKNKPIRKELLENLIFKVINENIFKPQQIEILTNKVYDYLKEKMKTSEKEIKKINNQIEKNNKKLDKILDYNLDGLLDDYKYKIKKNELELNNSFLKVQLQTKLSNSLFLNKQRIQDYFFNFSSQFQTKDNEIIRNIIEIFVRKITIFKNEIELNLNIFNNSDMAYYGGEDGNRTRVQD